MRSVPELSVCKRKLVQPARLAARLWSATKADPIDLSIKVPGVVSTSSCGYSVNAHHTGGYAKSRAGGVGSPNQRLHPRQDDLRKTIGT